MPERQPRGSSGCPRSPFRQTLSDGEEWNRDRTKVPPVFDTVCLKGTSRSSLQHSQHTSCYYNDRNGPPIPNHSSRPRPSIPRSSSPCRFRCRIIKTRIHASVGKDRECPGGSVTDVRGDVAVFYATAVRPCIDLPLRLPCSRRYHTADSRSAAFPDLGVEKYDLSRSPDSQVQ